MSGRIVCSRQSLLPFPFEPSGRDPDFPESTYYLCAFADGGMQISLSSRLQGPGASPVPRGAAAAAAPGERRASTEGPEHALVTGRCYLRAAVTIEWPTSPHGRSRLPGCGRAVCVTHESRQSMLPRDAAGIGRSKPWGRFLTCLLRDAP